MGTSHDLCSGEPFSSGPAARPSVRQAVLAHDLAQVGRIVQFPPPMPTVYVRVVRIGPARFLPPAVEQLGILTEDSLGNSGIKIIHIPPSYEEAATLINK